MDSENIFKKLGGQFWACKKVKYCIIFVPFILFPIYFGLKKKEMLQYPSFLIFYYFKISPFQDFSNKISMNLVQIFTQQAMARFHQARDEYLIESNNSLVFYWSISTSLIIICCGIFQVYFIKRLFSAPVRTNSFKR